MQKRTQLALLAIIMITTATGLILYLIKAGNLYDEQGRSSSALPTLVPTPTISPSYLLPKGEQVYAVSHGANTQGPKMNKIALKPLSFEVGETQLISVSFPDNELVGSVVVFIDTDNHHGQKITLKKESATNTWTGQWTTNDTILTTYSVRIVAVGASGEYNNIMSFL